MSCFMSLSGNMIGCTLRCVGLVPRKKYRRRVRFVVQCYNVSTNGALGVGKTGVCWIILSICLREADAMNLRWLSLPAMFGCSFQPSAYFLYTFRLMDRNALMRSFAWIALASSFIIVSCRLRTTDERLGDLLHRYSAVHLRSLLCWGFARDWKFIPGLDIFPATRLRTVISSERTLYDFFLIIIFRCDRNPFAITQAHRLW